MCLQPYAADALKVAADQRARGGFQRPRMLFLLHLRGEIEVNYMGHASSFFLSTFLSVNQQSVLMSLLNLFFCGGLKGKMSCHGPEMASMPSPSQRHIHMQPAATGYCQVSYCKQAG